LPAAAASRALSNVRTGFSALTAANVTLLGLGNGHFFLATVSSFLEANFHIVTEVIAALRLTWILPDAATEQVVENAAAAEDFAEDLKGIVKTSAAKSAGAAVKCGVAVLIVSLAFLRVIEHLVGLTQFFKAFFGGLIARVFVRMKFDG